MENNPYSHRWLVGTTKLIIDERLPEITTILSSATNLIAITSLDPKQGTVLFPFGDEYSIKRNLEYIVQSGFKFNKNCIKLTCSIHQNKLRQAKTLLIKGISTSRFSLQEKLDTIGNSGIALNLQIDLDPIVKGNTSLGNNIYKKMEAIGLKTDNRKLYEKYTGLNPYYNATKHANKPKYRKLVQELISESGIRITIDFFETVRRIFVWYYRKTPSGVPDWDELYEINYSSYISSYRYSLD